MKEYVSQKVARLSRLYDRIESVNVVIGQESNRHRTELVVHSDHKHTFVAHVDADAFHESVDLVIDKIERQLREHKEKLRNRKHQPGSTPQPGI